MTNSNEIQIASHGDPRTFADYAALHQEISKLSHPARPDPDWKHIEERCLALFRQNGTDLQSVTWFTLSLSHQHGPDGLRDGLRVTEALISSCWTSLWPRHPAERAEVIQPLVKRLQALIRTWASENASELHSLYQCEKYLCLINGSLKELGMRSAPGLEVLIFTIREMTGRLEQIRNTQAPLKPVGLETVAHLQDDRMSSPIVFVTQQEVSAVPADSRRAGRSVKAFLSGAVMTFALVCIGGSGWYYTAKTNRSEQLLAGVVMSAPVRLNDDELDHIRNDTDVDVSGWVRKIKQKTENLDASGIGRNGSYSADLALQAASLWPFEDATDQLLSGVIARREASAAAPDEQSAWQRGMDKLSALGERLNALDEKRGRYLTVSELKTAVFASSQAFSLHIPAEEWLRRYQQSESASEEAQFLRTLNELQARYDVIRIRSAVNNQH